MFRSARPPRTPRRTDPAAALRRTVASLLVVLTVGFAATYLVPWPAAAVPGVDASRQAVENGPFCATGSNGFAGPRVVRHLIDPRPLWIEYAAFVGEWLLAPPVAAVLLVGVAAVVLPRLRRAVGSRVRLRVRDAEPV